MAENDKKTILVVEDEMMVQMLVVDLLNDLGFVTIEANDGNAALSILNGNSDIDLMITDVGLPGIDGWELAKLAHQRRPALKILFLTGYESPAGRQREGNPLHEIMAKPFEAGAFESRVLSMLDASLQSGPV